MGDTTVQTGTQPNTTPQGDPAGTQQNQNGQNGNGATPPEKTGEGDKPLGPAGERALKAERERGDRLEGEIRAMKDSMKPFDRLLEALAPNDEGKAKSEVQLLNEKFAKYDDDLKTERQERWKAELANEFGLTAAQARRLIGATRDEMKADAEELVKDFEVQPKTAAGAGRPKPDRSQGGGSGQGGASGKDAGLAEARRRGFIKDK
jgi:hypothetical protein